MIGNYIDGLGWEILCDNLGLFVGYVQGSTNPTHRTIRPDDSHYQVFCETTFITKVGSQLFLNGSVATATNTLIPYVELTGDFVLIELNNKLTKCFLNNTTIEGDWFNDLETLYTTYLSIL
jgi:hypothetical protein